MAVNTFLGDYLPPKFCWSLTAGAQSQHSLLQPVPKSGVSSAWTPHSVHPAMATKNASQVPAPEEDTTQQAQLGVQAKSGSQKDLLRTAPKYNCKTSCPDNGILIAGFTANGTSRKQNNK